jgi:hypothetical protein
MKIKSFLTITAVLGCVMGLGFFIVPAQVMATFGVTAGAAHQHMARNFGSAVMALGVLAWVARSNSHSKAQNAIILALFTYFVLGSISILLFQLQGDVYDSGWIMFGLHLILAFIAGRFLFFHSTD